MTIDSQIGNYASDFQFPNGEMSNKNYRLEQPQRSTVEVRRWSLQI